MTARAFLMRRPASSTHNWLRSNFHFHGFVILSPNDLAALESVLRAAGGFIVGKAGSRQVRVRRMSDGAGWASYCLKDVGRTNKALEGDARQFLNRSMTQVAREFSR